MIKTILLTGATDGIGLETAKLLAAQGHSLLLHGRSKKKLDHALATVGGHVQGYLADLSNLEDVQQMASKVSDEHNTIDVLINNAGVLKSPSPITDSGVDIRFVVNTLAPYLLTKNLLPQMPKDGRILNLSSAAQATVDIAAMKGHKTLGDMDAYSQSKLAITMWSISMAADLKDGPMVLAVNPGSLLASKMVKEGFGIAGNDLSIGAELLCAAATSDEFANATGKYFDNDAGNFGQPHPDALKPEVRSVVVETIESMIS